MSSPAYRQARREEINAKAREYRIQNRAVLAEKQKKYYLEQQESRTAYARRYNAKNKDSIREKKKAYLEKNRDRIVEARRVRQYGEGARVYREVSACEVCSKNLPELRQRHIDHDHKTGVIRGVLCHGCNSALGHAKDSVEILIKLSQYLRERCG